MAYNDGTPIIFGADVEDDVTDVAAAHINQLRQELLSVIAALGTAAGIKGGLTDLAARFGAGTPTTQAFGDSAANGSSKVFAPIDHTHGMPSSVQEANMAAASVNAAALKTAAGSASGSAGTDVTMNAKSFVFNLTDNGGSRWNLKSINTADPGDQIARIRVQDGGGTWVLNWDYVTASRPPELVVVRHTITGAVLTVWKSELQTEDSPVSCEDPECEIVEVVKFPERMAEIRAAQIMADIAAGHLVLGLGIARTSEEFLSDDHELMKEARSRERRILRSTALGELVAK